MTDYSKLKVAELKDLIKDRGIAAAGLKLKQQFVDALNAADAATGGDGAAAVGEDKSEEENAQVDKVEEGVGEVEGETDGVTSEVNATQNGEEADATDAGVVAENGAEVAASADVGSDSDAINKRKRRSPTPPAREESASKRLKTADEEPAILSQDNAIEKPIEKSDEEEIKDAMDIEPSRDVSREVQQTTEQEDDVTMEDLPSTSTAKHSPTRALYIRNLVRPLQPNTLREYLLEIATHGSNAPAIEAFYVDRMRTHAFALFSTLPAAIRARAALHNQVWPDEPQRKPLFADFVPEEKVQEWIDHESTRDGMTRWEVVYTPVSDTDTDGPHVASLEEVTATTRKASFSRQIGAGEGMPNAPSGPRSQNPATAPSQPSASPVPQSKSFNALDASFSSTTTKPKIYFVPVPESLVEARLASLTDATRDDWAEQGEADESNYKEGEMRRYTFEDGSSLVDGGMDWGRFGMSAPRGGGGMGGPRRDRRRGGGGGGGGGWRGGGAYRGGDSYRGGAWRR